MFAYFQLKAGHDLQRRRIALTGVHDLSIEVEGHRLEDLEPSGVCGMLGLPPSANSSSTSLVTPSTSDDEDMRIIRRLLLRKIDARTSEAWDEMDKVVGWLRIIKEVIRGVKRRAYLQISYGR